MYFCFKWGSRRMGHEKSPTQYANNEPNDESSSITTIERTDRSCAKKEQRGNEKKKTCNGGMHGEISVVKFVREICQLYNLKKKNILI